MPFASLTDLNMDGLKIRADPYNPTPAKQKRADCHCVCSGWSGVDECTGRLGLSESPGTFFPKAHTLPYHHARFWLNPLKEIIKTGFLQELETSINKRQPCFPNSSGPAVKSGYPDPNVRGQ